MDPRLLQHYNVELQHIHEMGAEFAREFPKIAARLGMSGIEVADPYVERLLEGAAFLAARVQLKIDAEFPRFTQALLEMVYPHYLAPTPAMLVAQFQPDPKDPHLAAGTAVIPRYTTLLSLRGSDDATACEFRTARPLTLWPLELASASYFSFAPDLPLTNLRTSGPIKGGVRIRLKATGGAKFSQMAVERLPLFLGGAEDAAHRLYELCLSSAVGVLVVAGEGRAARHTLLPASALCPVGFDDDEALLPASARSFQGYRLLQEYFAFPQRFRFVELSGLAQALSGADVSTVEVVFLLAKGDPTLEGLVDGGSVLLHCTPAINLFPRRVDRIHVTDEAHEYHVVADRTRPLDFEIYQVTDVVGHGSGSDGEQEFLPFYSAFATDEAHERWRYFTVRREPRLVSSAERRRGSRSSYTGTEVFVSLVDSSQAPFSADIRQLSVGALCTNRDLVLQMPLGVGKTDLSLDVSAPVVSIRVVSGPSRPHSPIADGAVAWHTISHLSLNYLSLMDTATPAAGASALRELLALYVAHSDASAKRQVEGVHSVTVAPIVRRLPPPRGGERSAGRRLAFGRGVEVALEVDELAFEGGSAFLLGAVLNHFLARYVSVNSFTELVLRSRRRGEVHRWMPHWGVRPTL